MRSSNALSIMRYGPIQQAAKQLGSSHLRMTQRGREGEKEERERGNGVEWSGVESKKEKEKSLVLQMYMVLLL